MRHTFKSYLTPAILLLLGSLFLTETHAGDYDYDRYTFQTEAFAILGTGSWYDDDSGLVLGGGVVLRPYPKAGFEISYRRLRTEQDNLGSSYSESGHSLTASVHYYFSQLRFQPYLLLGGGFVWTESTADYQDYMGTPYHEVYSDSSFVLEAGGGVNIFITQKFSIRPDVRLMIGDPGMLQGAINFCYHW